MNHIAKNLKYLRKETGINQGELAIKMKKGQSTIGNWENEISEPNISEIQFLAHFFGITADDLLSKDLQNVHLNEKPELKNKGENVHLNVHPTVHLNKKKARNEPCQDCMVKDNFIAVNQQLLEAKKQIIDSQEARIKLLENKIEQMEYEIDERRQTQYSKKKEQKSA